MKRIKGVVVFALVCLGMCGGALKAHAGPYTDELSKCVVEATTQEDRSAFVRWLFSAASRNPAVKSITLVTAEQLDTENRKAANLFMRLLTESCPKQVEKAVKFEGSVAIQSSFQVLGEVAGRELFSSPEVTAGIAGIEKYVDAEKLKSVFSGK